MLDSKQYNIDLKSIKDDNVHLEFPVGEEFFNEYVKGYDDLTGLKAVASLDIEKTGDEFNMAVHIHGYVEAPCDVCLDTVQMPIDCDENIVVKYGDEYEDNGNDITVDERGIFDALEIIKDYIFLSVPFRHVHAPGKCNTAMLELLEKYDNDARSDEDDDEDDDDIDPRKSALKKLKQYFKD